MNSPGATLSVRDSAIFGGGSVNPNLNSGTLRIEGNFVQTGANSAASFNADPPHTVEFAGTGAQTVSFGTPGFTPALSHFGNVRFANATTGVTFNTNVFAHVLQDLTTGTQEKIFGSGFLLTAEGLNVNNVLFDNTRVNVVDNQAITTFTNATFQNYPTNPDILTVARSAPIVAFGTVVFPTTGFTGRYLVANDPDGAATGALNVTITTATPALPGTQCLRQNGALITWNGTNILTC